MGYFLFLLSGLNINGYQSRSPKTAFLCSQYKMQVDQIQYSERYCDDTYEYRHVILPPDIARLVPKSHLMTETEWRNLGLQQSPSWLHFMVHNPEPHVLLFRRLRTDVAAPSVSQLDQLENDADKKNKTSV